MAPKTRDLTEKERSLPAQPAGTIISFAGDTVPDGYLLCDGSELSQTTYADLFANIGSTWDTTAGVASPTAGNFRLPPSDIGGLGLYMRGTGATNGVVGTYQADVFKAHTHGFALHGNSPVVTSKSASSGDVYRSAGVTYSTGDATETRPRSITVMMCIKY